MSDATRPLRREPALDDPTIPVLTERLTLPQPELDFTLPPAPPATLAPPARPAARPAAQVGPAAPEPPAAPPAVPAAASGPITGGHWARIEVELRESILHELAQHLPQEVDAIVRRQMAPAIDAAVERLGQEARRALAGALREIVDRAVRAELDRLRSLKR